MRSRTHRVVVGSEGVVEAAVVVVDVVWCGADEDVGGGLLKVSERDEW